MRAFIAIFLLCSFTSFAETPLPTASNVDVQKYLGKWYSISALPQFYTRNCVAQTAFYTPRDESSISVLNTCLKKNGKTDTIDGQAEIINTETNAELIVTFNSFWTRLFRVRGDYTIIKLDPDYNLSLIGSKDRKTLWLLSRTPEVSAELKQEYLDYAKSLGFDISKIEDSVF